MSCSEEKIREEASGFATLEQAFRWAVGRKPRVMPDDVVVQDEYSHDVLFRVSEDCYIVFDTT